MTFCPPQERKTKFNCAERQLTRRFHSSTFLIHCSWLWLHRKRVLFIWLGDQSPRPQWPLFISFRNPMQVQSCIFTLVSRLQSVSVQVKTNKFQMLINNSQIKINKPIQDMEVSSQDQQVPRQVRTQDQRVPIQVSSQDQKSQGKSWSSETQRDSKSPN